jgi:hypothetical protein
LIDSDSNFYDSGNIEKVKVIARAWVRGCVGAWVCVRGWAGLGVASPVNFVKSGLASRANSGQREAGVGALARLSDSNKMENEFLGGVYLRCEF